MEPSREADGGKARAFSISQCFVPPGESPAVHRSKSRASIHRYCRCGIDMSNIERSRDVGSKIQQEGYGFR
jgi:hypothetical protein